MSIPAHEEEEMASRMSNGGRSAALSEIALSKREMAHIGRPARGVARRPCRPKHHVDEAARRRENQNIKWRVCESVKCARHLSAALKLEAGNRAANIK